MACTMRLSNDTLEMEDQGPVSERAEMLDPEAGNGPAAADELRKRRATVASSNGGDAAALSSSSSSSRQPPTPKKVKKPHPFFANAKRINVWSVKTRAPQWASLRSRWRFVEGVLFYYGPPLYLLRRIWPPLLLNIIVYAFVAADHLWECISTRAHKRAVARGDRDPPKISSLFPPLSESVTGSLDPVFRFSLFAISLLLTLRLGRVYDRWWEGRKAFMGLGTLAVGITHRALAWVEVAAAALEAGAGGGDKNGDKSAASASSTAATREKLQLYCEDLSRWATCWQFAVQQVCTDSPKLHPAARKLLKPRELALYEATPKGRHLVMHRLTRLLMVDGPRLVAESCSSSSSSSLSGTILDPVVANELIRAGNAAAGVCTAIKFQCLPAAISLTSTGVTQVFLMLYPLASLTLGKGGDLSGDLFDDDLTSVAFTLAIRMLIHLFVCVLLLGLAELSTALEDPFTGGHLPLEDMARTTVRDVARARREAAALHALEIGGEGGREGGGGGGGGEEGRGGDGDAGVGGKGLGIVETVDWRGAEAMCGKVES